MGLLGKIWVKLGLDNSELNTGFKNSEKAASGFQNSLKKIGGMMAAAFSVTAIVGFFKKSVEGYNADAIAVANLNSVLKATGGSVGISIKEMERYAEQLESVTTFEHGATMNAMAMMLTFKNIKGDVFKEAVASAQDLATIMGGDLTGAMRQVGVALESPILGMTRLRRAGVIFSDEQTANVKKLVADGKLYEAQLVILAAIHAKVGGAAKAAAETAGGSWKQAFNSLGKVMDVVGSKIENTIWLANTLKKIFEGMAISGASNLPDSVKNRLGIQGVIQAGKNADKQMAINEAVASNAVKNIHSVAAAQKALLALNMKPTATDTYNKQAMPTYMSENELKAGKLKAIIQGINGETQTLRETNATAAAEKAAADKKENDALGYGTIPNLERIIKLDQERLKNADNTKILLNGKTELQNIVDRIDRLTKYIAKLKEASNIDLPEVTSKIKIPDITRKVSVVTNLKNNAVNNKMEPSPGAIQQVDYDPIMSTINKEEWVAENKRLNEKRIKDDKELVDNINAQSLELQISADQMAQAISNSIGGAVDELVSSLMETGKVDTLSVVQALLQPFLQLASQLGEIMIASGIASMALDTLIVDGPGAIIAGMALVALSSAAGAAMSGAIKNKGKGGSGGGYSYNGGAVTQAIPAVSMQPVAVYGVLRGQDIYLSSEKYQQNKAR